MLFSAEAVQTLSCVSFRLDTESHVPLPVPVQVSRDWKTRYHCQSAGSKPRANPDLYSCSCSFNHDAAFG